MQVKCPKCGYAGNIADRLIPDEGKNISCPKCKTSFTVTKEPPPLPTDQNNQSAPTMTVSDYIKGDYSKLEPDPEIRGNPEKGVQSIIYEYRIEFVKESMLFSRHQVDRIEKLTNKLASEGWELDKVTVAVAGGILFKREAMILFFKRPRA